MGLPLIRLLVFLPQHKSHHTTPNKGRSKFAGRPTRAKLKEAHKAQDLAGIDTHMAALNTAWTAASEDMYKATQGDGGAQPGAGAQQAQPEGATAGTDNVTDVPYEEVK